MISQFEKYIYIIVGILLIMPHSYVPTTTSFTFMLL